MEEVVKNSISMIEFKKSQFLLEESKNSVVIDLENTKKELETKNIEFKKERSVNYILLSSLVVLIILSLILWFVKI
jgi:type IV secretory pathway TrbL component